MNAHGQPLHTSQMRRCSGGPFQRCGVATPSKFFLPFPLVWGATWHRPTALESAKKLRELDPARLAPGHGKIVESPAAAMDRAIARGV